MTMTIPNNNNMLLLRWCLLLLLTLLCSVAASQEPNNSDTNELEKYLYHENDPSAVPIVEYTDARKADFFATDKRRVVKFYSPYCGHCRLFRPKYVNLARNFQKKYPSIAFYAVSCVAHYDICQKYKVDAYPSIFTINAGDASQPVLLKPGKLTIETLEEAFGLAALPNDGALLSASSAAAAAAAAPAARNSNAAARESRHLEEEDEENDRGQGEPQRDDENDEEEEAEDKDEEEEEDEESKGEKSLGGFQDSANDMLQKIGVAAKKEFLDPFIANQKDYEDELDTKDEDDTDEEVEEDNNNNNASNEGNTKSYNRHADYEEEEDEGGHQKARQRAAKKSDKKDDSDKDDEENAFEAMANVAGLTVQQKAGAALARQRRGDMLPLRTKEGLRTSVLKRKGEMSGGGGFFLTNHRRNRNFAPPKPGLRPEDKPAPAGETDTMKAHRKGTQEFEDRKALILAEIERVKGRKVREEVEQKWVEIMKAQGEKGRAPYKKVVAKPRLVERLPIVKRLVPKSMGEEESLILDTSLSFLHGLKMGVFNRESGPLSQRKKEALTDWLDLMSIALPQEWGLQTAIDDLSDNIELISQDQKSLERILFRHKLHRVTWSDSCSPKKEIGISGGGFTCGFWKLIHTMTIGIAEHRGGQMLIDSGIVSRKTRTFTPLEAANTLRRYMDHFYICTECSRNFIADYDNCEHRLCDRLTDDANTASHADWKELGNWLWEVHNDVSLRLLTESRKRDAERKVSRFGRSAQDTTISVNDEIAALWPSLDMCIKCFNEDGSWNEDAVFLYLEHTYWPGATLDSKTSRLLEFDAEIDPEGSGLFKLLLIGLFGLLIAMWRTISTQGLQQTVLLAKRMAPKGAVAAKKRSL